MKKIFIADDDEAIVDATSMMLEMAGYEVRHTLNGATVRQDIQVRPDLVLLDIWMSGIDGRDVCRSLKADPETLDIPVLMISAGREIMESALESGADDFLAKPFDMDDLLEKVAKLTAK
ncbi:response regulator [Pedobacter sp. MC2016-15]|uniref:response regulator transcription factor n=1 Tax=Pedobacter sp. MC2016-15 TaxID=2994473 RepID=UPI002245958A|nr:response regulator [Pedobacter sp. MC2016-15]MCX2477634.1 response regulator [Pedobacter sp. MC2016-15]